MLRRRLLVGGAASAGGLGGCGAPAPPPPPAIDLIVTGSAGQNPDPAGRPSPVAVRIYELAGASKFQQADVFALIEREAETLGADLLGMDGFVLAPSQTRAVRHELKASTRYLGVAALFRDIDQATWRAVAAVAPHGPTRLALAIGRLSVALDPASA